MVDYQLDLDEYRKFYAELMNQSDEGNDSDNVGSSAAYALEQADEMIAGESAVEVTVSKPSLPLQDRDLDLRPKQHIPYKKTQEAKLMAGFCQIVLSLREAFQTACQSITAIDIAIRIGEELTDRTRLIEHSLMCWAKG